MDSIMGSIFGRPWLPIVTPPNKLGGAPKKRINKQINYFVKFKIYASLWFFYQQKDLLEIRARNKYALLNQLLIFAKSF